MNTYIQSIWDELPLHGGDIHSASKREGIPVEDWLDLSTGINPESYPLQSIPESAFHRLPYPNAAFIDAVQNYYQQQSFLSVCGTQTAIQALPGLINVNYYLPVLLPEVGYQEHAMHWQKAGNECVFYSTLDAKQMCAEISTAIDRNNQKHLVIINPNNPTCVEISIEQIVQWSQQLAAGAFLIVDEAFIDVTPEKSVLALANLPGNIIVLRSFGKFFGLAGLRVGFVFASTEVIAAFKSQLGSWQTNGPAQFLATKALNDNVWQGNAIEKLLQNASHSYAIFEPFASQCSISNIYRNAYFTSYQMPLEQALTANKLFSEQGILTRFIKVSDNEGLLRIATFSQKDSVANQKIRHAIAKITTSL